MRARLREVFSLYAVVESGGKQYRVAPGQKVRVDRLEGEIGSEVRLDRVLVLVDDQNQLIAGTPVAKAVTIAAALIFYGIIFIFIENANKNKPARVDSVEKLDYKTALLIGLFQVLSLIPGTSRSGITIIGAILIGTSRMVAAEFTFFLSIPVMFGQSLIKLYKFGFHFTSREAAVLLVGMAVAFIVSMASIRFLMNYVKKHDFKVFGWYRIVLGVIVLAYFLIFA